MRPDRRRALLLLALTVAPFPIYTVVAGAHDPNLGAALVAVAGFLTIGLMSFYLIHLYSSARIQPGRRALWLALIVFANIFAMPFYWYFHYWPKDTDRATHPAHEAVER